MTYSRQSLTVITPPVSDPVTLAEAKLYLRVDGDEEDELIGGLIAAAAKAAEQYLSRSLVTQSWEYIVEAPFHDMLALPMGPVQSVTSVKAVQEDGSEQTLSASAYRLLPAKWGIGLDAWPSGEALKITYVAGYGSASDLPQPLRYGVLTHLAALYESRGENTGAMPDMAIALYTPFREVRL